MGVLESKGPAITGSCEAISTSGLMPAAFIKSRRAIMLLLLLQPQSGVHPAPARTPGSITIELPLHRKDSHTKDTFHMEVR
jgi:hypothetical protein